MLVRELVEMLQRATDQEAEVQMEGCDCDGDVAGASYDNDVLLLRRSKSSVVYHDMAFDLKPGG